MREVLQSGPYTNVDQPWDGNLMYILVLVHAWLFALILGVDSGELRACVQPPQSRMKYHLVKKGSLHFVFIM